KEVQRILSFLMPREASVFYFSEETHLLEVQFDYLVFNNQVGFLKDIQTTFEEIKKQAYLNSRLVIVCQNSFWKPAIKLAEFLGFKGKSLEQTWLGFNDLQNFLGLAGFEVIKRGEGILCPFYFPLVSGLLNRFLVHLPLLRRLGLAQVIVARPQGLTNQEDKQSMASIIIPARNEQGNIEVAVQRLLNFPAPFEIIFVEGHSKDDTLQEIKRVQKKYPKVVIKVLGQDGVGKGDAVRKGFEYAMGEVLMILDADLTMPPEELPKFYWALVNNKADFINGSRLVYPLQKHSMQFLNVLGNKFFGAMFSWLLGQKIKDTLCGTKVLWKKDYEAIKKGRTFFGDFDPFGDFDLLFGASKLNLKIIDLPIRYQERTYGQTNIQRFKHGWLLLKMVLFAMRKIKFI
ncbi:MAG: glycosyltransferase family 2 protein, partial [Candidatus Gribaldobacteria bacterium]|nr:glycosyltransferase family 2 protein [Candidatus Gribaldobacteria bacterium]